MTTPTGLARFPHLIINQARVLDYFAEAAAYGPGRIVPDFGYEFTGMADHDPDGVSAAAGYLEPGELVAEVRN